MAKEHFDINKIKKFSDEYGSVIPVCVSSRLFSQAKYMKHNNKDESRSIYEIFKDLAEKEGYYEYK